MVHGTSHRGVRVPWQSAVFYLITKNLLAWMGDLYITGAASLLTSKWANRATRRSVPSTAANHRCRADNAFFRYATGTTRDLETIIARRRRAGVQYRCWALRSKAIVSRPFLGSGRRLPAPAGRRHPCRSKTGALSSARGDRTAPDGSFAAVAALPANQLPGRAVTGLPDPNFVVLRCRKCHISSSSITTGSAGGSLAHSTDRYSRTLISKSADDAVVPSR